MYARPKPGETEKDLLRLQNEFEKNKAENKFKPAATVVSTKTEVGNSEDQLQTDQPSRVDIEEQLANTFEAIPQDIKLSNIVEKECQSNPISLFKFNKTRGFPQAKRRDASVSSNNSKGSIFAQQMKKLKKDEQPMEVDYVLATGDSLIIKEKSETSFPIINKVNQDLPTQSFILSGEDSKQIHEENLEIIKNLSEKEIMEEREKLLSTLDPALIAYLKSRRKKEVLQNRNPTIKEQNEAAKDVKVEEIETAHDLLKQPKAEAWLNFDIIETNKLAWMKDIDIPKIKSDEFEARFDFEGWLLPYSEPEITEKSRTLYHHGEDPGRPGYTLQELFQLSRSSVAQQKILALNGIANILSLNSTGVYDEIIDIPFEQIFFVLRFCLDDNTPAILNASIKAMRNLVFSQVDETCLDSLLGFGIGMMQPLLAVENETEDDYTVNDQQLAEKNLVKCLARTEILTRIRYIINTVQPPLETIVHCMDVLIRLARDSDFIVSKILNSQGLIDNIVKNFVPVSIKAGSFSPYGLPLVQSVKLLRILSSRNKSVANVLINKYNILDAIVLYLSNDVFSSNINGLKLQTECMHYWNLLVHYGLTIDYFCALQPILLTLLEYHFKNTNLDMDTTFIRQGHLAAFLILLASVARQNLNMVAPFLPLLENCISKWSMQFSRLRTYACGKLQTIASLVHLMSVLREYKQDHRLDATFIQIVSSRGFDKVTKNIISGSMLLNNYETHKTSSNLKSLEAAVWHTMDHVVPVIQTNSCIPFLCSLSQYIRITNNSNVVLLFLQHNHIKTYLNSLQNLEKYYLTNHWFARIESVLLMNILHSSVFVRDNLDTSTFYELAVKCLSIFSSEQKPDIEYLLEKIVFSSKFYPADVLMEHLDIYQRNASLEISLSNLDEIREVYIQVLGLKNDVPNLALSCSIDISIGNVIPIDWIYTPILILYSNQQQNKGNVDDVQQIFTVKNCLRWILIYESYFPFLASTVNPTDKFCRLACVFLGSDSLFLTKEIHDLLELCLRNLITKYQNELNFNKEIQGLNNFQDFYTQLLEQYQGVSYGDTLFGNVILVPLAQKHNIQYRKTLWSEYMGVVQIFNITPDQCLSNLDLFLTPPENDISILKSYRRAIITNMIRKHSVLYKIANYHVEKFISNKKQER